LYMLYDVMVYCICCMM